MQNRIKRFLPKTETTLECPYCHECKVTVPYGVKEPTRCPECNARFNAYACPDGTPGCKGHVEAEPSEEIVQAIKEWRAARNRMLRDQQERPEAWQRCWREDCNDGIEMRFTRGGYVPVGPCDECEGTGKVLRV